MTEHSLSIGTALSHWLETHNATITTEKRYPRGRRVMNCKTDAGMVIICVVKNEVKAVAVQMPLFSADELKDALDDWYEHSTRKERRREETVDRGRDRQNC